MGVLFYTHTHKGENSVGSKANWRPAVKELNCQYQFHGTIWRDDSELLSGCGATEMRSDWEANWGASLDRGWEADEEEDGLLGMGQFNRGIQSWVPLPLSRLGYTVSSLHVLQQSFFLHLDKSTEETSFETERETVLKKSLLLSCSSYHFPLIHVVAR